MENLRHVKIVPYIDDNHFFTLQTWDTFKRDGGAFGRCYLRYKFKEMKDGNETLLFEGKDFSPSPMHAIDSDNALRSLLGFLTLKPGDTDDEYFDDYTNEQMEFAETHAEVVGLWTIDDSEESFENLDDWEDQPDCSNLMPRRW